MQKSSMTDPLSPVDEFLLHHSDMGCGATESDPTQLEPKQERFPERWDSCRNGEASGASLKVFDGSQRT
jgi:hypothetical protein